jgi:hypothetical protein
LKDNDAPIWPKTVMHIHSPLSSPSGRLRLNVMKEGDIPVLPTKRPFNSR